MIIKIFLVIVMLGSVNAKAESMSSFIYDAKLLAGGIADHVSSHHRSASWRRIANQIYYKLDTIRLRWPPPGKEFKNCFTSIPGKGVLAYHMIGSNEINLCRRLLEDPELSKLKVAQVLIHESAHAVGFRSECDATKIEEEIMIASELGLAFRNGYNCR